MIFCFHKITTFTIVRTIQIKYNCYRTTEQTFLKKGMSNMNKKQELIERIEKLTPEQFELLIALYSQQEQEFVRASQVEPLTFPQHVL